MSSVAECLANLRQVERDRQRKDRKQKFAFRDLRIQVLRLERFLQRMTADGAEANQSGSELLPTTSDFITDDLEANSSSVINGSSLSLDTSDLDAEVEDWDLLRERMSNAVDKAIETFVLTSKSSATRDLHVLSSSVTPLTNTTPTKTPELGPTKHQGHSIIPPTAATSLRDTFYFAGVDVAQSDLRVVALRKQRSFQQSLLHVGDVITTVQDLSVKSAADIRSVTQRMSQTHTSLKLGVLRKGALHDICLPIGSNTESLSFWNIQEGALIPVEVIEMERGASQSSPQKPPLAPSTSINPAFWYLFEPQHYGQLSQVSQ